MIPALLLAAALPPAVRIAVLDLEALPGLRTQLARLALADRRFDPNELERELRPTHLSPFDPATYRQLGFDPKSRLDVYSGAAFVLEGTLSNVAAFDAAAARPHGDVVMSREARKARIALGRAPHDTAELLKALKRPKPRSPRCAGASTSELIADVELDERSILFSGSSLAITLDTPERLGFCVDLKPRAQAELAMGMMSARRRAPDSFGVRPDALRARASLGPELIRHLATALGATAKDAAVLLGELDLRVDADGISLVTRVRAPDKGKESKRSEVLGRLAGLVQSRFPGVRWTEDGERFFLWMGPGSDEELKKTSASGGSPGPEIPPILVVVRPNRIFDALEARALRGEYGPAPMALTFARMGFGAFLGSMSVITAEVRPKPGRLELQVVVEGP